MKYIIFNVLILLLFTCCQQKKRDIYIDRLKPIDLRDTATFVLTEEGMVNVPVVHPSGKIKASDFIEDFQYIPLETVDSSFMGQYVSVHVYKKHIFIQDVESGRACIFDMNGKYINKIGVPGGAPGEFVKLNSITIDPFHNHLVAYDTFLCKLLYFTLDGGFLYAQTLPLRFNGDFRFIEPNLIAFINGGTIEENPQLKDLNQYDIIYTDSTLNIRGGVLRSADSCHSYMNYGFNSNNEQVAYTSTHFPFFYEFVENKLSCKYHFDYTGYGNVFDIAKLQALDDEKKKMGYLIYSTRLLPPIVSTKNFLWFKTQTTDHADEFYSYYDRMNNRMRSFKPSDIEWDTELLFTSVLGSYGDYMIGYVPASLLIDKKAHWDKSESKKDKRIIDMIDNLEMDDNDVLVLFKLKSIQ